MLAVSFSQFVKGIIGRIKVVAPIILYGNPGSPQPHDQDRRDVRLDYSMQGQVQKENLGFLLLNS